MHLHIGRILLGFVAFAVVSYVVSVLSLVVQYIPSFKKNRVAQAWDAVVYGMVGQFEFKKRFTIVSLLILITILVWYICSTLNVSLW